MARAARDIPRRTDHSARRLDGRAVAGHRCDTPVPCGERSDRSGLRRRRPAAPSDRRRSAGRHASDPRALRRQLRRRVDPIDRRAHRAYPHPTLDGDQRDRVLVTSGTVRIYGLTIKNGGRVHARRRDHDRARLPLPGRANARRRELGEGARRWDQRRLRPARGLRALGGAREPILRHGRRDLVGRLGEHSDHRWGRHQGEQCAIPRGRHLRKHDVHRRGRPSGDQWQSGRLVRGAGSPPTPVRPSCAGGPRSSATWRG